MTPDGRCKFGDASANGYVRSDGVVMLALKRLSSAQADGDHIYAVIRGSAVTNDGRSSGFLATPGQAGQEEMLRRAYADAGVDPGTVQYVEAHGTGTSAGDPVEVGAIGAVIGAVPGRTEPLLVGSIKSNIGHCEGAAGAAGLVKLALALEYGDIPASLHVATAQPRHPVGRAQDRGAARTAAVARRRRPAPRWSQRVRHHRNERSRRGGGAPAARVVDRRTRPDLRICPACHRVEPGRPEGAGRALPRAAGGHRRPGRRSLRHCRDASEPPR